MTDKTQKEYEPPWWRRALPRDKGHLESSGTYLLRIIQEEERKRCAAVARGKKHPSNGSQWNDLCESIAQGIEDQKDAYELSIPFG